MSRNLNISREVEEIACRVVDAVFHVHFELGPGLLESVYGNCFEEELRHRGLPYSREVAIPLRYRSRVFDASFRADFVVEGTLLVELKAVETLLPMHKAQVITYLKLANLPLGVLANFNVPLIKDGLHRLFNPRLR